MLCRSVSIEYSTTSMLTITAECCGIVSYPLDSQSLIEKADVLGQCGRTREAIDSKTIADNALARSSLRRLRDILEIDKDDVFLLCPVLSRVGRRITTPCCKATCIGLDDDNCLGETLGEFVTYHRRSIRGLVLVLPFAHALSIH